MRLVYKIKNALIKTYYLILCINNRVLIVTLNRKNTCIRIKTMSSKVIVQKTVNPFPFCSWAQPVKEKSRVSDRYLFRKTFALSFIQDIATELIQLTK